MDLPERSLLALAVLIALIVANGALLAYQLGALWRKRRPRGGAGTARESDRPVSRAITTALSAADLAPEDQQIVHKAIDFSRKTVSEVMVPRPDMICVHAAAPLAELFAVAGTSSHSRIPVYDRDLDNIVGFVHAKDLIRLAAEPGRALSARDLMREILAVPENKAIDDMLREFQERKTHVAIVIDEFGGTSGMVTINDLLEELVGELFDEIRPGSPEVVALGDGSVRVAGRMSIESVNARFGLALPDDEFNTIAGLVFGCLGRTPATGDEAEIAGVRFRVEATNGRRATQLVLRPPA